MKKALGTGAGIAATLLSAQQAFAQQVTIAITPPTQLLSPNININEIIRFVLQLLVVVGVLASLIFLIYGGIKWITSGGDKAAVEAAQKHVVAAVVGLVVIILAFVIISFVLQLLGVTAGDIFNIRINTLKR